MLSEKQRCQSSLRWGCWGQVLSLLALQVLEPPGISRGLASEPGLGRASPLHSRLVSRRADLSGPVGSVTARGRVPRGRVLSRGRRVGLALSLRPQHAHTA